MFIAITKPVQFIVIKSDVNERKNIFVLSLKILINSFFLPKKSIINNKKKNDHIERWLTISIAGMKLISLKYSGCGKPQKNDAIEV